MTNLTPTQTAILTAAVANPARLVLPLPAAIKGGAAIKVIASLAAKGLIAEEPAQPGDPVWRDDETLVATDAAFTALGLPVPGEENQEPAAPKPRKTRDNTKQALMISLLKRPEGATVEQIAEATGWLKHTIRSAITVAVKKKLGLIVTTEKVRMVGPNREGAPGSYTIYRITE